MEQWYNGYKKGTAEVINLLIPFSDTSYYANFSTSANHTDDICNIYVVKATTTLTIWNKAINIEGSNYTAFAMGY